MKKLAELAVVGLGGLMVATLPELGVTAADMAPTTSEPSAIERSDGSFEIARRKGSAKRGSSKSRADRRARSDSRRAAGAARANKSRR